jgi:uroporphyrinogen-III synthase
MRVLVTRPEPGATRTVEALTARGIAAEAIALTEIQPVEFTMPGFDSDALIITSQNAILHGAALLESAAAKPVFAVGHRTAEMLAGQGFAGIKWAKTAGELLPVLTDSPHKRLLYICGQNRRPQLEAGLALAHRQCMAVEVYKSVESRDNAINLARFFANSEKSVVLLHAPSAATAFVSALSGLTRAGTLLDMIPKTTQFLCMSAIIADALPLHWQHKVTIANCPDNTEMFNQLEKMLVQNHVAE